MDVVRSMQMYEILEGKSVEVPDDVKQSLLELVSFFNHKDPLPLSNFEERSSTSVAERIKGRKEGPTSTWEPDSFGERLFKSIQPTTPVAYNTMICALTKHGEPRRAKELFVKATEEGVQLLSVTYDAYFLALNEETLPLQRRWTEILDILKRMQAESVQPTAHTLHAIVTLLSGGNAIQTRQHAEVILAEFNRIGIRPMLATYSLLFELYAAMPTQVAAIEAILSEVEGMAELTVQCEGDIQFIVKAMEVLRFRIKDSLSFVYRLDRLARDPRNATLLGDSSTQQTYYRHLLCAVLRQETWPEFFRIYNEIVPVLYSLEPSTADEMLSKINITGAIEHIPLLCQHMNGSEISRRTALTESLLRLMLFNTPSEEVPEHKGLNKEFARIANDIYSGIMEQMESAALYNRESMLNSSSLSSILTLQLRGDDFAAARELFQKCLQPEMQAKLLNALSEVAVIDFMNACIKHKHARLAIKCIEYGATNNMISINRYAAKLIKSGLLEADDVTFVKNLVGEEALIGYENENENAETTGI